MATVSTPEMIAPPPAPLSSRVYPRIVISEQVSIPSDVVDLESFCRWRCSEQAPEKLNISYLAGTIWVDLTMEEMYTHNRAKTKFAQILNELTESADLGIFLSDGMLLRNPGANLSTEPDGTFVTYQALKTGQVKRVARAKPGTYELQGSPEMTLEVVSATSVHKDTVNLRELYYNAGILEYWLVDVRNPAQLQFDVLRHGATGYTKTRRQAGGWLRSNVFGRSFLLTQSTDPLGDPKFILEVR